MAESEAAPAAGARALGEESAEVRKIGALLRGEGDDGQKDAVGAAAESGADARAASTVLAKAEAEMDGQAVSGDAEGVDGRITLLELAKSLGVKEGELYDEVEVEVEVTREDGTKGKDAITLGDLRRGYVGAAKLERERANFEEDSDKRSLEFMQVRAQLEGLGALIAPYAPREVVDRMNAMLTERDARERALLLDAVPEWKDGAKFAADRTSMIEFLKPWGFSAADVYGIADHRIARFVRDMARKEKRTAEAERKARAANGEAKKGQEPTGRRGVPPLRARLASIVKAGRASSTTEGKTEAIGALLRSTVKR